MKTPPDIGSPRPRPKPLRKKQPLPVNGWLTSACGQRVERLSCPRPGLPVAHNVPAMGVLHTIEGALDGGLSVFKQHYAPHFAVGGNRIVQLVPLGEMSSALEHIGDPPTNGWARVQIEVAGHSQQALWDLAKTDPATFQSLSRLMAALHIVEGVPLTRPFPDKITDRGIWASKSFSRRRIGVWGRIAGWYGHLEVPGNEHWDPGQLNWSSLLTHSRKFLTVYR